MASKRSRVRSPEAGLAGPLLRLARALASANGRDEISRSLVEAVPEIIGIGRSAILLWDSGAGTLRVRAASGFSPQEQAEVEQLSFQPGDTPLLANGLAGADTMHLRSDTVQDPLISSLMERFGAAEAYATLIQSRAAPIGIVVASRNHDEPAFSVDDEFTETMSGIADLAATAFENARLMERERETIRRLKDTSQFKSEFLGVVSHELRTPIAAIVGMARTLAHRLDQLDAAVVTDFLASIVDRGEQLERIVGDLLQSSREIELRPSTIDLARLVRGAVEEARQLARARTIELDVPDRLVVFADGMRIRQVVDNLLTNALKYGGAAPIEVEARRVGEDACVVVSDGGPGMTSSEVEQAFEAFFQGEAAADGRRGVGLGLYISRRIIEAHGGSIEIDSRPGEGTKVTVGLPTTSDPHSGQDGSPSDNADEDPQSGAGL